MSAPHQKVHTMISAEKWRFRLKIVISVCIKYIHLTWSSQTIIHTLHFREKQIFHCTAFILYEDNCVQNTLKYDNLKNCYRFKRLLQGFCLKLRVLVKKSIKSEKITKRHKWKKQLLIAEQINKMKMYFFYSGGGGLE